MAAEAPALEDATALAGTRGELDVAWRQFGAARTPEEFCRHWLTVQCHAIEEVHDAVVVLQKPGEEAFAPVATWPEGRRERAVGGIAERALREGRGLVEARDNE